MDYDDTFSLVVPSDGLITTVGQLVFLGWHVRHAELSTTFRDEDLNFQLYVEWDSVCYKVNKSLYELKHPLHLCYESLKNTPDDFWEHLIGIL